MFLRRSFFALPIEINISKKNSCAFALLATLDQKNASLYPAINAF